MRSIGRLLTGLRFRLLLMVVLSCTPLVGWTLHRAWEGHRRQLASWQQRAQKLLQVAGREEEELVGGTRQLLLALSGSSPVRSGNQRACKKLLDELFASYPRYANLGVIRTNGELLASAVQVTTTTSVTNQVFFKRALERETFSVGNVSTDGGTGKGAINFGQPVFGRTGEVEAVVFAALDLHWFDRFGSELPAQLPNEATWTEVNRAGTMFSRYPTPELWIGRPFPDEALVETAFSEKRGATETTDVKGVRLLCAFASRPSQLAGGSVVGILSVPTQIFFAQTNRALIRDLAWSGVALGLALTLGWVGSYLLVMQPVNVLVEASARLASGDLSARTGLAHGKDKLGRLTRAFDMMAQALERRQREQQRANDVLQGLSRRLVEVQEAERRHIARELHDEIGQTLTVAGMSLQAALQAPGDTATVERLEQTLQAIERVQDQVHDLSLNLRPSMLDDLGLESALRWYTHRQAALTGLQAEFRADVLEGRLDPVVETECFRVAQEALTNVVRHAQARQVSVELRSRDEQLHLSVRDDGIGFEVPAVRDRAVRGDSLGLLSMEERATLAGGTLEYKSVPGQGTEVHACFPLKWRTPPNRLKENE